MFLFPLSLLCEAQIQTDYTLLKKHPTLSRKKHCEIHSASCRGSCTSLSLPNSEAGTASQALDNARVAPWLFTRQGHLSHGTGPERLSWETPAGFVPSGPLSSSTATGARCVNDESCTSNFLMSQSPWQCQSKISFHFPQLFSHTELLPCSLFTWDPFSHAKSSCPRLTSSLSSFPSLLLQLFL